MQNDPVCFFCNVDGKLFLVENDYFYSTLDEYPVSPGHILVVPKVHVASLRELPPSQGAAMVEIVQKTLRKLSTRTLRDFYLMRLADPKNEKSKVLCEAALNLLNKHTELKDFNIGINDGPSAGQTIPHLHIHVMPRFIDDGGAGTGGVRHIFPAKGDYKS